MSNELLTLLASVTAILLVLGLYSLLADVTLRDRSSVNKRMAEEFRQRALDRADKASLFGNVNNMVEDGEEPSPSLQQRFEFMIGQSGLEVEPSRFLTTVGLAGLMLGCLTWLMLGRLLVGVTVGLMVAGVPLLYAFLKSRSRRAKLLAQLPDAFDLMGRAIRAGQTVPQAMMAVAEEFPEPIKAEFSLCYEQMNLGLPPEVALRVLAQRTGLLEIKIFVLAVIVQQQTGGNFAELLDKLANVVRERFKVTMKVRAMTTEGRVSAMVLLLLPVCLFAVLLVANPEYIKTLFNYPLMIAATVAVEALGALWIYTIANIDF
jgi:tight adherence protein B